MRYNVSEKTRIYYKFFRLHSNSSIYREDLESEKTCKRALAAILSYLYYIVLHCNTIGFSDPQKNHALQCKRKNSYLLQVFSLTF